jgi:CubicO group peptidase (beta-lactamase class C family)
MKDVLRIVVFLTLISTVVSAEPLPSGSPESVGLSSERLARIVPVMQAYVDAGHVSGITTAVVRRGKIAHLESVGLRDIERKLPMKRDTIFRIYSMSKPITTVAAMILYEEGKFELREPVAQFLPQFKDVRVYKSGSVDSLVLEKPGRSMRVHDLMRHTSGLMYGWGKTPVDSLYKAAKIWDRELTLEQFGDRIAGLPLRFEPGEKWAYGVSIDILGLLVEVVSGQPFEDFLQERIFAPLGMVDTGFYVPAGKLDRFATYYRWRDEELKPVDERDPPRYTLPPKAPSGGGGLVSTVDDYLRFAQMILNGGELDGRRILGPSTIRYMLRDHLKPDQQSGTGRGFGLGFAILRDPVMNGQIGNVGDVSWSGIANTFFWIDLKEEMIGMAWTQLMPYGIQDFRHQIHPLVHAALLE